MGGYVSVSVCVHRNVCMQVQGVLILCIQGRHCVRVHSHTEGHMKPEMLLVCTIHTYGVSEYIAVIAIGFVPSSVLKDERQRVFGH